MQFKLTKRLFSYVGHLTQDGKEVLVKPVAQSIPTNIMSVFKVPMEVCDDIQRMVRNYYWGVDK